VVQEGESIHVVPEEVQKEVPPSYAVAQADSAPAYYETFVHTPSSGLDGEVLVDSMRKRRVTVYSTASETYHGQRRAQYLHLHGQCLFLYRSNLSDSFLLTFSTRKFISSHS
jgi:hypothetical protein